MPQMDDAGGEASVLAPQAAMQQADQQIGILAAPAAEGGVESVDPLEIGAPDGEIAGARPAPAPRLELAQRPERQPQHTGQPIDAAAPPLAHPPGQAPRLGPEVLAQPPRGETRREQHAVAGHEPSALGQPAMYGKEIGGHDAIAVEKDAVVAAARLDRAVTDFSGAESAMGLPHVAERNAE